MVSIHLIRKGQKWILGEFEKYFDTAGTNNIIGMQILTADVMEMLIDFLKKYDMRFDIVIKNNIIYLRFHSGTMFEAASIKKGAFDETTIKKYYDMVEFTYNLSDKIIKTINETEF